MSTRQGSASYTIAIGAVTAIVVGAMLLTWVMYPYINSMTAASFWTAETTAGARVNTFVEGIWIFWGAIILISILSYVWISTRQ